MPKKGQSLSPEHLAALSAGRTKALKGKKQSPEHVKARFDGLARVRAATVRVSRNDAAMLEIARQLIGSMNEAAILDKEILRANPMDPSNNSLFERSSKADSRVQTLHAIGAAWLDGEDVLLAKLSQ